MSKTGNNWENFLFRNNFTLPKNVIKSPLHLDENPSPWRSNPTIENLYVNLQEGPAFIDQTPIVIQEPSKSKTPKHDFIPIKSLEEVLVDLKDKTLMVPSPEPIRFYLSEPTVNK